MYVLVPVVLVSQHWKKVQEPVCCNVNSYLTEPCNYSDVYYLVTKYWAFVGL